MTSRKSSVNRKDAPGSSTSEVGSLPAIVEETSSQQCTSIERNSGERNSRGSSEERWQKLLEIQSQSMMEIIRGIQKPVGTTSTPVVTLPKFNPDSGGIDAKAWCLTADLCMEEEMLRGSVLINALSRAMKGSAAAWFPRVSFVGMTWEQFRNILLAQYDTVETPAATLVRINSGRPKEGECLAAYSNTVFSSLMSSWKDKTVEEVAIAVTLAHAVQVEPRLQRLAFTTDISSRSKLQQELMAYGYRKRTFPGKQVKEDNSDSKKMKPTLLKCYGCGKPGHRIADCRSQQTTRESNFQEDTIEEASGDVL
jgi:hypothetical protein